MHFFTKNSLRRKVQHLIKFCYLQVGNVTVLQTIGIPMGIHPVPFWTNLYQSKHECDFMVKLIKKNIARAKTFLGNLRCIADLCALNNGGYFQKSFKEIYPKGLMLKLEYSRFHATFLHLNIPLSICCMINKLYDKRGDFCLLFACQTFIATSHHVFFM